MTSKTKIKTKKKKKKIKKIIKKIIKKEIKKKNMIIHQYHVTNNVINIKPSKSDQEDPSFLVKVIKKFTENVEYIADQASKGRQAALRLSNNNSSSSINTINESEKEV